ncbi:MAG: 50S ribosomal protein L2 [Patescibacteria group bacterium]|nr:50S ribosomal protein L2 [Patescibacteria group bacterium]
MALKTYKPTTSGRRQLVSVDYSALDTPGRDKKLTCSLKKSTGRNSHGRITSRRRSGGAKQLYRILDFSSRDKLGIPARIESVEYDPYRTAFIAKLIYADGERRYILAAEGMKKSDKLLCDEKTKIKPGNRMMLKNIPMGQPIHNIELILGHGGSSVRSAGSSATLTSLDGEYAQVLMPSKEVRYIHKECLASVGVVSNADHSNVILGKAGRARHMNRRPSVLGSSMNPVDHPHGGGEGHTPIGLRKGPKTPWGKPALGKRTRKNKSTSKWIAKSRHKSKK